MKCAGRFAAASVSAGLVALLLPAAIPAASIKVTTTADEFGGPGGTGCALREAVKAANTNQNFGGCKRNGSGNADTIKPQGGQLYQDSRAGVDDTNATGDLDIKGKTTIEVRGQGRATLDGNNLDRVIDVLDGARLAASRLIVEDGAVPTPGPGHSGGGIRNEGTLLLRSSSVVSNTLPNDPNNVGGGIAIGNDARRTELVRVAVDGNAAPGASGGGITHFGGELVIDKSSVSENDSLGAAGLILGSDERVKLTSSTISGNDAVHDFSDAGGMLVSMSGDALFTATNVTISGNTTYARGGGIYSIGGDVELNAVTITDNTADANGNGAGTDGGSGGGIHGNTVTAKNSIVVANTATNGSEADCANSPDPDEEPDRG